MSLRHEEFVRVLYRGLLGREPDAAGLASHLAHLQSGDAATAIDMVQRFTDSGEFRRRRNVTDALPLLDVRPEGPPFLHVASLGPDCYPSLTLKNMGLKRYSLPFDWIFSSLPMVVHCIEDDFQTFLDPRQYRPVDPADRSELSIELCEHEFYRRAFDVPRMFNHFDPSELRWHAYLVRAVGRFRRLLASPAQKLFMAITQVQAADEVVAPFARLIQTLESRTTHLRLMVVAVLPMAGPQTFSHAIVDQRGPHTLSVLQPVSRFSGIQFADTFDDLCVRRLVALHRFELLESM